MSAPTTTRHELRFEHLVEGGHGYAFPCDPLGRVDLDSLSSRARNDYFFARALIGRELSRPMVIPPALKSFERRSRE